MRLTLQDPGIFGLRTQCDLAFAAGHLHEILSSARDLRVLKRSLSGWLYPQDIYDELDQRYSRLEFALRDITYPKLYELSLSACEVASEYLVDLCLRHKATLRHLYLCDISLADPDDDWRDVFISISISSHSSAVSSYVDRSMSPTRPISSSSTQVRSLEGLLLTEMPWRTSFSKEESFQRMIPLSCQTRPITQTKATDA